MFHSSDGIHRQLPLHVLCVDSRSLSGRTVIRNALSSNDVLAEGFMSLWHIFIYIYIVCYGLDSMILLTDRS